MLRRFTIIIFCLIAVLLCPFLNAMATQAEPANTDGWQPQICGNSSLILALDAQGDLWEIRHGKVQRSPYENIVQIAASGYSTLFASREGAVLLERGNNVQRLAPDIHTICLAASELDWSDGSRYFNHLTTPKEFDCLFYAVDEDGALYAWGNRRFGLVGNGKTGDYRACWTRVDVPPVKRVSTSGFQTGVVTADGEVFLWGTNWYGELGLTGNAVYTPTRIEGLPKAANIFCSFNYTLVLARDGTLWGSGTLCNSTKNLVPGQTTCKILSDDDIPRIHYETQGRFAQMDFPSRVVSVSGGSGNVLVVLEDGSLYAWGSDFSTKPTKQKVPEVLAVHAGVYDPAKYGDDVCFVAVTKLGEVYRKGRVDALQTLEQWTYSGLNLLTCTYDQPSAPLFSALQKGDKGDAVVKLRQALIDAGYLKKKAKGSYDKAVIAAVKEYQKSNGLEETGVADEATQCALYKVPLPTPKPQPSVEPIAPPTIAPAPTQRPPLLHAFPSTSAKSASKPNNWEKAEVTISAATSGYDYYVQIRNAADDFLEAQIWIKNGDSRKATVSLAYGTYYLQLAAGPVRKWYGEENLFQQEGIYQKGGSFTLDKRNASASISLSITTDPNPVGALSPSDFR